MGDYLKEAYLLAEINRNIDDEYQKLSDKLDNLRLSHNRKVRALKKIRDYCSQCKVPPFDYQWIIKVCDSALFCDGRERSKR